MSRELHTFDAALERVTHDITRIGNLLRDTDRYLRGRYSATSSAGGWRQFLQEDGAPSAAGTSCSVTALVAMGVARTDTQLKGATEFLMADACADGGWSKPRHSGQFSLTLTTCMSLLALADMEVPAEHPAFSGGLTWLTNAQNPDGGWGGIARDGLSDTTSTAYAIRVLTADAEVESRARAQIDAGVDWLTRGRSDTGGWGVRGDEPPSLAHTSHAVEALLAAGRPRGSLRSAQEWMVRELGTSPLMPWVEHYNFPDDYGESVAATMRSERLRWTHLPAERSLIALMKLGHDPRHEIVGPLVEDIVRRHQGAYWQVQSMPGTAPSWAVVEAVRALDVYRKALETTGYTSVFREIADVLVERMSATDSENVTLRADVAVLEERVAALETARESRSRIARALRRVRAFCTSPATLATLVIATTAALVVLYLQVWSPEAEEGDRMIGVSTIIVPALALLEMVRRRGAP